MDTGVIIAIVVAALILLALFAFMGRKGRERKLETRRHEAREIGREAEVDRAEADRTRAEADAQSAEARRQEALARERAAEADEQHREARERHIEAASHHPDMDEKEAAARVRPRARRRRGGARRARRGRRRAPRAHRDARRGARAPLRARRARRGRARRGVPGAAPLERKRPAGSAGPSLVFVSGASRRPASARSRAGSAGARRARSARGGRGGRVARAADDVPGADRELVHAAVGPAAADGARVVARLAPGDAAQVLLAPARHAAAHLELEAIARPRGSWRSQRPQRRCIRWMERRSSRLRRAAGRCRPPRGRCGSRSRPTYRSWRCRRPRQRR